MLVSLHLLRRSAGALRSAQQLAINASLNAWEAWILQDCY
jgi:hypothetical protein